MIVDKTASYSDNINKILLAGDYMTRGFVTLATGNIKYYRMALNMLNSFRIHNPNAKFAIVCDKNNEITKQFDDVVVLEKANGDYRDKFSLLINSPYDETIFIEPDCLIYRNLDFFWDLLSKESDFSAFGWNADGVTNWFKTEETLNRLTGLVPELNNISHVPHFNPGYFFIRKGEKCRKMYDDCVRIAKLISEDSVLNSYKPILCHGNLRDDPIFNIAMAVNSFICNEKPKKGKCISLPSKYKINKIDIIKGLLDVTDKNGTPFSGCSLLHFSTKKANEEGLYLWQTILINFYLKKSFMHKILNNKAFYGLCCLFRYTKTRIKHIVRKR